MKTSKAARSRIRDADIARESARLVRTKYHAAGELSHIGASEYQTQYRTSFAVILNAVRRINSIRIRD